MNINYCFIHDFCLRHCFVLYYRGIKETAAPCYNSFSDQPSLRSSKAFFIITSEMVSVPSVRLIQLFDCIQSAK